MVSMGRGPRGHLVACPAEKVPATELGHVMTQNQPMAVELATVRPNSENLASYRNAQVQ